MPVMKKRLVVTTVEVMVLTVMQERLVVTALEVMVLVMKRLVLTTVKVMVLLMKKRLVVTTVKVMVLLMKKRLVVLTVEVRMLAEVIQERLVVITGVGAYNQGAYNDEEEIGGHSCRDAFDFEEKEEPWGAFI